VVQVSDLLKYLMVKYNMRRYSDSYVLILPPRSSFEIEYVPPVGLAEIVYAIVFSPPREFDPDTMTVGSELSPLEAQRVGFWRYTQYEKWHWIPMLPSNTREEYPQFTILGGEYGCIDVPVNDTDKYVLVECTVHVLEFAKKHLDSVLEDIRKFGGG